MTQHTPGPSIVEIIADGLDNAIPGKKGWGAEHQRAANLADAAPRMLTLLASCLAYFDDMKNGPCAAAAPDAIWTAPIRALLSEIEGA